MEFTLTYPGQPHHDPPHEPAGFPASDPPPGELAAVRDRAGARWAGRALLGSLLLALATAPDPDLLNEPAAGHMSVAMLLLTLQVPLVIWVLTGHERERARPARTFSTAGHDQETHNRWEGP